MDLNLDHLPDAVLVIDAAGTLVGHNAAAVDLFGPLADRVGAHAVEALDIRDALDEVAFGQGYPDAGEETEYSFRRADDTEVAAAVTCRVHDGTAVLSCRPVSDESGIAIVSTVSHELRSPLTSVKGYVSLMLNRWDRIDDDKKREMLTQVHNDADRVTRLVTELLDISRLETGRLVLRRQMVDLGALARTVVEKVAMAYPALDCDVIVGDDLPEVYVDPDKIEQVLTNLVENAAKYGDPRGMVVDGAVETGGDGEVVRISVTDVGPGIPAAHLPKVFSKFFRGDHGRPTGTGLGLWISRGLVEAHGGELVAASTEGSGSTFSFTIPTDAFERLHDT